jgi:hypothetical protein
LPEQKQRFLDSSVFAQKRYLPDCFYVFFRKWRTRKFTSHKSQRFGPNLLGENTAHFPKTTNQKIRNSVGKSGEAEEGDYFHRNFGEIKIPRTTKLKMQTMRGRPQNVKKLRFLIKNHTISSRCSTTNPVAI